MRFFIFFLIISILYACSFDDKSGIWQNQNVTLMGKKDQFKDFKKISISTERFDKEIILDKKSNVQTLKPINNFEFNDVFYNNDGRTTEVPTEMPKKFKEQVGGQLPNTTAGFFSIIHSASNNNPVSQDEKEDNLINIQNAIQNGGNDQSIDKKSFFSEISSINSDLSIDSD